MPTELSDVQRDSILAADKRINLWSGSVRSGKTVALQIAWLKQIRNGPKGPLLMVGKTHRTLTRNVLDPMLDFLGPQRMQVNMGMGEARILGRKVYLVGANDERAMTKIQGLTLAGLYGDEVTTWPASFFKMGLSRLSIDGAWFGGSTNPDAPLHWLKREFIDREAELDMRVFHFRLTDNPYLGDKYVASLSAEYTGLWRKRYIDGLWVAAEGPIYDMFDTDVHVIDAVPKDIVITRYWVGCDYGTSNPFVALLLGHGSDGVTYVLSEWRWDSRVRMAQMTDAQYRLAVEAWVQAHVPGGSTLDAVWIDPSAASFIVECSEGWLPAMSAQNEVLDGIRYVSMQLAKKQLRILASCRGTIDEMSSYAWDPKAQEKGEDKPLKVSDHGPDALRYGLYSDFCYGFDPSETGWR